jgi:pimeloyl-ACP methyl ester carboxylesterase
VARLRSYEHDGLTFDYEDRGGDGEPVVVLHGYPGSHRSWDRVAPALSKAGYRVLAPDQRGYSPGARPRGRRAYTLDRAEGDLLALADAVGAPRFHLVGHDWGGAVAWVAATSHPERLASMTSLTTPHPRALMRSTLTSTQGLRSVYMLFNQIPWLPEKLVTSRPGGLSFVSTLVRTGLSKARAEEYLTFLRAGAAGPAVNWYRAIPFNRSGRVGEVSVPALYVYGTDDFALTRRAADLTGRYVTGPYHFVAVEGASHWIPEEHAEVVTPLIVDHLRANPL